MEPKLPTKKVIISHFKINKYVITLYFLKILRFRLMMAMMLPKMMKVYFQKS